MITSSFNSSIFKKETLTKGKIQFPKYVLHFPVFKGFIPSVCKCIYTNLEC